MCVCRSGEENVIRRKSIFFKAKQLFCLVFISALNVPIKAVMGSEQRKKKKDEEERKDSGKFSR